MGNTIFSNLGTAGELLAYLLAAIAAYLLGSFSSSIVFCRLFTKTDIRCHGSGNAGATNMLRTVGWRGSLPAILGDLLKGVLAVLLGRLIAGERGALLAAAFCLVGHCWPLYFGFKGGKAVLTSAAVMYMLDWRVATIAIAVFLLLSLISRRVSVGSVFSSLTLPVVTALLGGSAEQIALSAFVCALILFMHRPNIKRLLNGTEPEFSIKRSR